MPKYFNTTQGPVNIDAEGRIIGGGEWFDSKQTPEIKAAVERGELVVVSQPKNDKEESKDSSKTAGNEGA